MTELSASSLLRTGIDDPGLFNTYRFEGRSFKAHRAVVRGYFGFRESTTADLDVLAQWGVW